MIPDCENEIEAIQTAQKSIAELQEKIEKLFIAAGNDYNFLVSLYVSQPEDKMRWLHLLEQERRILEEALKKRVSALHEILSMY